MTKRVTVHRFNLVATLCVALSLFSHQAFAQTAGLNSGEASYVGCDDLVEVEPERQPDESRPSSGDAMRDRMAVTSVETQTRTRVLQGMPIAEAVASGEDSVDAACWRRLDGMWREDRVITLDKKADVGVWDTPIHSMRSLAHGNYTTARALYIAPSDEPDKTLKVVDAYNPKISAVFESDDDVSLDDVLTRNGKRKVYRATEANDIAERLRLSVTYKGYVQIEFDDQVYKRPGIGVLAEASTKEYGMEDVFIFQSNPDSFDANLRSYDITTQDPFRLLRNDKAKIFKTVSDDLYRIQEKRTIPLGFELIPEVEQGMVYQKTANSTEKEIQSSVATTYGLKARAGLEDGAHLGAGAEYSESTANAMRDRRYAAQAVGYSRAKQYAILIDDAFVQLDDDFIDAVQYARRFGGEEPELYDRIITKYGTHYAYAVTYGANAKLTYSFTEEETEKIEETMTSFSASFEAEMAYANVSGSYGEDKASGDRKTSSFSSENIFFDAVGGNGSFDEKGYAAGGVVVPILLDLRPIHELLNPLNFPGQPEIYTEVREKLRLRISDYMALRAAGLSDFPIINTKLEGEFYSDDFPGLIFNFESRDFANSRLKVRDMNGTSFRRYIAIMAGLDEVPERDFVIELEHSNYQSRWAERADRDFKMEFLFNRIEGGGYGLNKTIKALIGPEAYSAIQYGVMDSDELERLTLMGRMGRQAKWMPSEDGLTLTAIMKDGEEPVLFKRWTEEDAAFLKDTLIDGAFKSDIWPDYTFRFGKITDEEAGSLKGRLLAEVFLKVQYDKAETEGQPAWFEALNPFQDEKTDYVYASLLMRMDVHDAAWNDTDDLALNDAMLAPMDWYDLRSEEFGFSPAGVLMQRTFGFSREKAGQAGTPPEDLPSFTDLPMSATWRLQENGSVALSYNDDNNTIIEFTRVEDNAP